MKVRETPNPPPKEATEASVPETARLPVCSETLPAPALTAFDAQLKASGEGRKEPRGKHAALAQW